MEIGKFLIGDFSSIIAKVTSVGGFIGKWIAPLLKFVGVFSKFLGPIGLVITAFQLISSIWKNFDISAPFFGLDKVID